MLKILMEYVRKGIRENCAMNALKAMESQYLDVVMIAMEFMNSMLGK